MRDRGRDGHTRVIERGQRAKSEDWLHIQQNAKSSIDATCSASTTEDCLIHNRQDFFLTARVLGVWLVRSWHQKEILLAAYLPKIGGS